MTESPLTLFGRGLASQARCCREMSASASRRDNTDRSLARSATESVPRKNRPVGYGMIGRPCTAKGVLEDQDSNTFLRAENAMNVQARESVCHGKKLYRRPEIIQQTFFQFSYSKFRHSNHRIGAQTCANHTVPYGTVLLGWRCPRHFVPGYDRTVPPGHFATGFSWAKVILAGRAAFPTKRVGCCACRRPSYLSLLTSVCSGGGGGSGFLAKPDRGRPD